MSHKLVNSILLTQSLIFEAYKQFIHISLMQKSKKKFITIFG